MKRPSFYYSLFAFSLMPHLTELPLWTSIVTVVIFAWSIAISYTHRFAVPKLLLNVATLAAPALVYLHFGTILGAEAASALFCVMAALKLHEVRSDRDEIIVLILCALMAMNWLLFSQSIITTIYMIVVLFFNGIGLMLIQAPMRSVRDLLFSSHKLLLRDVLLAVPIFLAFFFLFPRFSTPLANILNPDQDPTGFSDDLSPGRMADLVQSQEIAFRALFEGPRPRQQLLYWQGKVLEDTDGWKWFRKPLDNQTFLRNRARRFTESNLQGVTSPFTYELILEPRFENTVFHLENAMTFELRDARARNRVIDWRSSLEMAADVTYRTKFSGTSDPQAYGELKSDLTTAVPIKPSARLAALATEFKKAGTPDLIATQILNYFRDQNYRYSTTTPEMKSVDEFLFDTRVGFCEHYASAFAILARLAGVPARVVVGFQGGEYNSFGNYLIVRDKNAHAWAEIYVPNLGWKRVDPTSVVSYSRIANGEYTTPYFAGLDRQQGLGALLQGTAAFFESLNSRYILFLLNFDSEAQLEMFGFGGRITPRILFAISVFTLITFGLLLFWWGRHRRRESDPITDQFTRLLQYLEKSGFTKRPGEGHLSFAERISIETQAHAQESHFNSQQAIVLIRQYNTIRYAREGAQHTQQFIEGVGRITSN